MLEPAWIMVIWSIGTALLAAGAAWGAVLMTQKQSRKALSNLEEAVTKMGDKVQKIDKGYISHTQCHEKQGDCLTMHRNWETTVTAQLSELKTMITVMDEKREATRFEMMKNMRSGRSDGSLDHDKTQELLTKLLEKLA